MEPLVNFITNYWNNKPDASNDYASGYIINIADGWGGSNEQSSSSADVRILASLTPTCGPAEYDSG